LLVRFGLACVVSHAIVHVEPTNACVCVCVVSTEGDVPEGVASVDVTAASVATMLDEGKDVPAWASDEGVVAVLKQV